MLICPICDSTLVNRVCPICKKIVKNPWVLDDRVFINRSHSLPDDFCEYHGNGRKITLLNKLDHKGSSVISAKQNPLKQKHDPSQSQMVDTVMKKTNVPPKPTFSYNKKKG